jgi:hypothetical protein
MSEKRIFAGAGLVVLLTAAILRADAPKEFPFLASPTGKNAKAAPVEALPEKSPATAAPGVQAYAPDAWVYQQPPDCCSTGFSGPIGTELYVRGGASFPIASADFKKALRTGWEIMGGGRSLFFSPDGMRAWIVDLGLSYTINNGHPSRTFLFNNGETVTIRNLHRTALSLALGHDWFMFGPGAVGNCQGTNWRYGIDAGGRWGTAHLDLNPINDPDGYARTHDVYGAAFLGLHVNCEIPLGAWTFLMGLRGEWSYSFMDLLPNQSTSLHDLNALVTMGVRW